MTENILQTIKLLQRMTLFKRTTLILPFAFMGMLLAADGIPGLGKIFWILVALISSRNLGMALNRLIDHRIDQDNPRTRERLLPTGQLSRLQVYFFALLMLALFLFASHMLNPLCLKLSPLPLALICLYPFMKRFTWTLHLVLGVIMAFAPFGSWVAIRGSIDFEAIVLSLAVVTWVAGFDVISDTRDVEYYKTNSLHSLPCFLGVERALVVAKLFHLMTLGFLIWLYYLMPMGAFYLVGLVFAGGILLYEHHIVTADDLSRVPTAFLTVNTTMGLTLFFFTLLDVYLNHL